MKIFLALLLLCPSFALAAQHAVLIGVSDYPGKIEDLQGPVYDVELIKDTLINFWGYHEDDIITLVDENASKENILAALTNTYEKSTIGDNVFVYFSGHGTSASDPENTLELTRNTGAFLPHDIGDINADNYQDRLIIGKRDLSPIFKKMDLARLNVFFTIDACYSANTVRSKNTDNLPAAKQLPARYQPLSKLIKLSKKEKLKQKRISTDDSTYPYNNIFSLAAAQEYEAARDIPANKLSLFPTIDGKPHGAFTDALARALQNKEINPKGEQSFLTYREVMPPCL